MTDAFARLWAASPAAVVVILFAAGGIVFWVTNRSLREGREISFWPPRIGPRVVIEAEPTGLTPTRKPAPVDAGSTTIPSLTMPATPIAMLRVEAGPNTGRLYVIGEDRRSLTIGRGSDCDVSIPDAGLSRTHARLVIAPESQPKAGTRTFSCQLLDSGSSNGTFINGRRVDRHSLVNRDLIEMGGVRIRFVQLA